MNRLVVACALLFACSALPIAPSPEDYSDQLRDQLAKDPEDPRRGNVMEQLAKVELERARTANTIVAYRRFLQEFPAGDEAVTARSLLEDLRFEQARKANTSAGWEAFLAEHPRGHHEIEARNALGTLEIAAALASTDLGAVRLTLARFPDHPSRAQLLSHEDDLAWASAAGAGSEALEAYLSSHPNGAHRLGAMEHQEANELKEIRDSEDLPRALALTSRADATESQRALVAELQLNQALRNLDFTALKSLAATKSAEPTVVAVLARAKDALQAFDAHPLTAELQKTIAEAAPGAGLPTHAALLAAVQNGDPTRRVAALRELAEGANPDDIKAVLVALQSEYVSVRLEAIETLRTLASSLKPEVWRSQRRTRESELLNKELTPTIWRQVAALRDADGQAAEAATAWRAVLAQDSGDLAARGRLLVLAQQGKDRIATGSTARDLAKEAIEFADNRWTPAKSGKEDQRQGKGKVVGVAGNLTILRQICTALDLGTGAVKALGVLAADAPVQEQQLLNLARTDGEASLNRIRARRAELEKAIRGEDPSYPACESDLAEPVIAQSRQTRIAALTQLGAGKDARLLPFVDGLVFTPGADVRAAAQKAAAALRGASPEHR